MPNDWQTPETWEKIGATVAGLTASIAALRKTFSRKDRPTKQKKKRPEERIEELEELARRIYQAIAGIVECLEMQLDWNATTSNIGNKLIELYRTVNEMHKELYPAIRSINTILQDHKRRLDALEATARQQQQTTETKAKKPRSRKPDKSKKSPKKPTAGRHQDSPPA